MSAKRPVSASAIPRWKDSGIHESSDSTTYLATSARCLGGNALNCLMTVWAVMAPMKHARPILARDASEWARAMPFSAIFAGANDLGPKTMRGSLKSENRHRHDTTPARTLARRHATPARQHGTGSTGIAACDLAALARLNRGPGRRRRTSGFYFRRA